MQSSRSAVGCRVLLSALCIASAALGCVPLRLPMAASAGADDYFAVLADINGEPVRLVLDTGAEASAVVRRTAVRLGLKITEWPSNQTVTPGKLGLGSTEQCTLTIWSKKVPARFRVLELPAALSYRFDGVLGWPAFRDNIMHFEALSVTALGRVPAEAAAWLKLPMRPHAGTLGLILPDQGDGADVVEIDSGGIHGVSLNTRQWQQWTARHPNRPRTLDAYYMPGAGLRVQELTWADEISLGPLTITDVPLREANVTEAAMTPRHQATLGLAAMRRLEMVVDGGNHVTYVRVKRAPAAAPQHNRLGAVFVPADLDKTEDLIAIVLDGTPAWEAGIRDGDVLLRIGEVDMTRWRVDPAGTPGQFWSRPRGTRLQLRLRRGRNEFQTIVVLRDLIGPRSALAENRLR